MKDFDQERAQRANKDRAFRINGYEFQYRPAVAPQSLLPWSRMVGGEFVERHADGSVVLGPDNAPLSSLSEEKALEIYDQTIRAFLVPGQEDKWEAARDPNAENPINLGDLTNLIVWLFEETSGRPTGPPSSSSGSSTGASNGQSGTGSTVALPSPPAAVQA